MKETRVRKTPLTHEKEPLRLLALSDGLFATVLTLLVLDLRIPDALNAVGGGFGTFTHWLGPHFFGYLMTFFVAGNFWLAHHRNFDRILRYDRGLLGYNLLFLLFVGLFPFTTASISQAGTTLGGFPPYWAMYAANFIMAGVMQTLTWLYAVSHDLVDSEITRREHSYIMLRQIVNPAVFLLSIGAEYLFPQIFLGPWTLLVLLPVLFLVERFFAPLNSAQPSRLAAWPRRIWQGGVTLLWILLFGLAVWVLTH